ncbi:Thylakoid soluble phosphoprotein TSP9 [Dillenia turbinata]|uniref:Thylakoid soluble phosphoprotein TSP9 n=1 Tax=Dillenia turbinata TaxID=194707 RepID=A0AAN8ZF58_9MAGN
MASLTMVFSPVFTTGSVYAATATKSAGGSGEEKGLWDWILGGLQKEDQLLETDPILKKVEEKTSGGGGRKNSVAVPPKKKNGNGGAFGGLGALWPFLHENQQTTAQTYSTWD